MANRTTFNGTSTKVPWRDNAENPEGFGAQYARHIKALYDASALPLTAVAGSADDVTAVVDPVLDGPLVDGMKFTVTWAQTNIGPMTLKIGAAPAASVIGADGSVMIAGAAKAGSRALLEFIGGSFRVLSGGGAEGGGSASYYRTYTASGDWIKPAGLSDNQIIIVEAWGGGGGGRQSSAGGGGGGYSRVVLRGSEVPSLVPVSVGSGGVAGSGQGSPGGNSTFGSLLTAYGGQGAATVGGAGGGELASGAGGGAIGGGRGGVSSPDIRGANDALTIFGGGGGGAESGTNSRHGGRAAYGAGGGAGQAAGGVGGASVHGGYGGDVGQPGQAPGGGGAGGFPPQAGARGEVRIWIP